MEDTPDPVQMTWTDRVVTVDGVSFSPDFPVTDDPTRFHIRKPPHMIRRTIEFAAHLADRNLVELGIAGGGSVALHALVGAPRRLLALELNPLPLVALDRLITSRHLQCKIHPTYGIDQSDRSRVLDLVDTLFEDEQLHLVIDDASHLLGPTVASFETLFPRLAPGAEYVIEDWRWQHQQRRHIASRLGVEQLAGSDLFARALEAALADPTSPHHAQAHAAMAEALDESWPDPDPLNPATVDGESDDQVVLEPTPTFESPVVAPSERPLSTLGVQLLLAKCCGSAAIGNVTLEDHWIRIERGQGSIDHHWRLADEFTDYFGQLPRPDEEQPPTSSR